MKRLPIVYDDRSNKSYWRSLTEKNGDPEAWAAQLRRMLHLSLALHELLDPGLGAG